MAKEFAQKFYKSAQWKHARQSCIQKAGGLCEVCYQLGRVTPGVIVHHEIHLAPENIHNAYVTCALENLELVCIPCHTKIHNNEEISQGKRKDKRKYIKRFEVDDAGNVKALET